MRKSFQIVVAATTATPNLGIGRKNDLPWKLPGDMAFFKKLTTTTQTASASTSTSTSTASSYNAVIMGRKTWESIPSKFRPLVNRLNIVLTHDKEYNLQCTHTNVAVASSLIEAIDIASNDINVVNVYVIGGGSIYSEAIQSEYCSGIYLTSVEFIDKDNYTGIDTFFSTISAHKFYLTSRSEQYNENGCLYRFNKYELLPDNTILIPKTITDTAAPVAAAMPSTIEGNIEEQQYLDAVNDIITNGIVRGDRTGTGTISKFGTQMRFSLRNKKFPLLTTKKVFWRGVAEELLWFVKGSTNANDLAAKDIHIWDGNGSKEFLKSRGLGHRDSGDLGPVYGYQWRHYGAEYIDMHADYSGKGIDQLRECIDKIKKSPDDRRIIMTAWNPSDLDKMALPPCHMFCQFYVANGELSCCMYQRSADMGLGVPFNIASYSLLTVMMAQVCQLVPGDFVHMIGDAHVYANHIDALKEQVKRTPREFPTLTINPAVTDIDGFVYSDFTIDGYAPDTAIKMKMAV